MGKKKMSYTLLAGLDHKQQFVNMVAVISAVTPSLRGNKLFKITLELSDNSLHGPGFIINLKFKSEVLNQFLDICKKGLFIELLDVKLTKNEGVVYADIKDEEEINLYSDNGSLLRWYSNSESHERSTISDTLKSSLKHLLEWKKAYFVNDSDTSIERVLENDTRVTRLSDIHSDVGKSPRLLKNSKTATEKQKNAASKRTEGKNKKGNDSKETSRSALCNSTTLKSEQEKRGSSIKNPKPSVDRNQREKPFTVEIVTDKDVSKTNQNNNQHTLSQVNTRKHKSIGDDSEVVTKRSLSLTKNKTISPSKLLTINKTLIDKDTSESDSNSERTFRGKRKRSSNQFINELKGSLKEDAKKIKVSNTEPNSPPKIRVNNSKLLETDSKKNSVVDNKDKLKSNSPIVGKQIIVESSRRTRSNSPLIDKSKGKENKIIKDNSCSKVERKHDSSNCKSKFSQLDVNDSTIVLQLKSDSSDDSIKNENKLSPGCIHNNRLNDKKDVILHPSATKKIKSKENSPCLSDTSIRSLRIRNPTLHSSDSSISNSGSSIENSPAKRDKVANTPTNKTPTASAVKTRNVSPAMTANTSKNSIETSLIKVTNAIPIKIKPASLIKMANVSPVKSTSSCQGKPTNSSPLKTTNASSNKIENSSPIKITNVSPTKIKNASPVNAVNVSTVKAANAFVEKAKSPSPIKTTDVSSVKTGNASPATNNEKLKNNIGKKCIKNQVEKGSTLSSSEENTVFIENSINTSEISGGNLHNSKGTISSASEKKDGSIEYVKDTTLITKSKEDNSKSDEKTKENIYSQEKRTQSRHLKNNPTVTSNPDIDVNNHKEIKKTSTDQKQNSFDMRATKRRSQLLSTATVQEESKPNQTRNSLNKPKVEPVSSIFSYLEPLTRKIHLIEVESITDISAYDLEDIEVPEKFDIICKVVSFWTMLEDCIQVVRVQDGTFCKCDTLEIPEHLCWNDVTEAILKGPVIKKKSPFIDIIIFDFSRMDKPIVLGKYYEFRNIMAIKLNLKNDPRKGTKSKRELFFCGEGQNVYVKKIAVQKGIEELLNSDMYRTAWNKTFDNDVAVVKNSTTDLKNSSPIPGTPKKKNEKIDSMSNIDQVKEKDKSKESSSPEKRKRKLNDSQIDADSSPKSPKRNNLVSDTEKEPKSKNYKKSQETQKPDYEAKTNRAKVNITISSDETMLNETPAGVRELREIMHEESLLGLPLTVSEDIHLKNSGSEVTFSQFCEAAKLKGMNFRTSTQNQTLSESIVPLNKNECTQLKDSTPQNQTVSESIVLLNGKECGQSEESSKMEPLVYCPSGSSMSSAVDVTPVKISKLTESPPNSEQCSESVLQNYKPDTSLETKAKSKTIAIENSLNNESKDDKSDISNSSSIKVISSNSSILEYEIVRHDKVSKGNINTPKEQDDIDSTNGATEDSDSPIKIIAEKNINSKLEGENVSLLNSSTVVNAVDEFVTEDIEVVSSSNASFFSVENSKTFNKSRKCPDSSNFQHNQSSSVKDFVVNENDPHIWASGERLRKIPERSFFTSRAKLPTLSEDELNEIYKEDNDSPRYFSYSYARHLPFLTLTTVFNVADKNYLTISVTLTSITPTVTESWQESGIKARCPTCNKLFDVYNAANNKCNSPAASTNALAVGGHIVCPDSQCCNNILENPEFNFSLEMNLQDGTPQTALIGAKHAEELFGCTAQETVRSEDKLRQVTEILTHISTSISNKKLLKINVTRENIFDPKSGPLYIKKIFI